MLFPPRQPSWLARWISVHDLAWAACQALGDSACQARNSPSQIAVIDSIGGKSVRRFLSVPGPISQRSDCCDMLSPSLTTRLVTLVVRQLCAVDDLYRLFAGCVRAALQECGCRTVPHPPHEIEFGTVGRQGAGAELLETTSAFKRCQLAWSSSTMRRRHATTELEMTFA